jgi:uncharacterized protein
MDRAGEVETGVALQRQRDCNLALAKFAFGFGRFIAPAATQFARKRHRHRRARTACRLGDRFDRRSTGGAADVAREALSAHGIRRTVGIATLDALADLCWQRRLHPDVELGPGIDAFDATDIRHGDNVVVVGAFVPFFEGAEAPRPSFLDTRQDPATLKADELPFFRPAEQTAEILRDADVVLITGSTLVNNTLEHLLALSRPEARVTVVGPTVGMLPDAFLARGADVLGCVRITEPDAFLDLLAEGGSGYHFFGRSAQKLVLARRSARLGTRAA